MLLAHFIGAIFVFIGCYPYLKTSTKQQVKIKFPTASFAEILIDCIENSIQTLLRVGGIIVFYYILSAILTTIHITPALDATLLPLLNDSIPTLEPILAGTFEFVQGVIKLSQLPMDLQLQLALIAFCTSFAGFSVHTQTFMFAKNLNISYFKYFCFRFLHGLGSFTFIYVMFSYFIKPSQQTVVSSGIFHQLDQRLINLTLCLIFLYFITHFYCFLKSKLKKDYA